MSQYLKISHPAGDSCSKGLRLSITYIGKHYGRRANREGYSDREYFRCGKNFIAKRFGAFSKTAVLLMVKPKRIKGSNVKQWCYNKRVYAGAYKYILELLLKNPASDKVYVAELLNRLYQDVYDMGENNNELARLCSNALLFWQKEMLGLHLVNSNIPSASKEEAGKILMEIAEVDRPLP